MKKFFFVFFFLSLSCPLLFAQENGVVDTIDNGSYLIARQNGQVVSQLHPQRPYIPASIFKIITSLASLEILGEDYRFPTYFYITPGIDLWIKGEGDPLLISEEIILISKELKKNGLREFRNLYIDESLYALEEKTISESSTNNPYDTPLSALGVNFNTINIEISADGQIYSGEEQTPTIPMMIELGQGLETGVHRINVSLESGQTQRLAAETFKEIFAENGIKMKGKYGIRKTPSHAGLFYIHYSKPLIELIPSMLLYSNNFMANQFFLAMGRKKYGSPATWAKARRSMRNFATRKGVKMKDLTIIDGAGLNRKNQITAQAMVTFLQEFRPYHNLLPVHKNWLLKSGTMTGVYSYAGYLGQGPDDPAIVIILNQELNNREAVLETLAQKIN